MILALARRRRSASSDLKGAGVRVVRWRPVEIKKIASDIVFILATALPESNLAG